MLLRRATLACLGLALALAVIPSPVLAADDSAEVDRMQKELQRQQTMLRRIQRGEQIEDQDLRALEPVPEEALPDQANPRVAPTAPVERSLPIAIFDESRVTIEARQFGNRSEIDALKRVLDADQDGRPELIRYVDRGTGQMVRQEEDTNYDGMIDAWSDYENGAITARVLDSNADGNPDTWERYQDGRMVGREIDRDDDGVRDAFYVYAGGSLVEERHDSNNDGKVDLQVWYQDRRRVKAEEDQKRDGKIDTWRTYSVSGDVEYVSRLERDTRGRGFADTFETFEAIDGRSVLASREEDVNGDGEIDIKSLYKAGKLVRRQILDPELVPL